MARVHLTIDDRPITAEAGRTVLEAALENGVDIPHLCSHENLHPSGGCRLCVVRQEGETDLITACSPLAREGMVIHTKDALAERVRRLSIELMLKTHPTDCTGCPKYGKCQLLSVSQYVGDTGRALRVMPIRAAADDRNPLLLHEMHRCVLCGRCVRACEELRGVGALRLKRAGEEGRLRVVIDGDSLAGAGCRFCGACVEVCPTGSIRDKIGVLREDAPRKLALIPCMDGCPARIDIPKYIRFIHQGDYAAATAVVREKAPFPESLGYICSRACEARCRRGLLGAPLSIRNLKRFAASHDDGAHVRKEASRAATGKKVAVIGAGSAGLTAAHLLARLGHEVTVLEAMPLPGGQMRYGIPAHRLPREVLMREIDAILSMGVRLQCGMRVESISRLMEEGYDAALVAVGTHRGRRLPLPNADLPNVRVSTEFLRAVNAGEAAEPGERVIVLGGGGVALDCAECALRLGARAVHIVCLEAEGDMPADAEEIAWAREDGIIIHNGRAFEGIEAENGAATGLWTSRVKRFSLEDGRAVVETEEGSRAFLPADTLIFAVGQQPDILQGFELALENGYVAVAGASHQTDAEGVFAAGDAVTDTRSVIDAIAGAREAAREMDRYLGGDGEIDGALSPAQDASDNIGRMDSFADMPRQNPGLMERAERIACFAAMDRGLDARAAGCEADRCLQCDLRERIAPQRFWSDYATAKGGDAP